MSLSKVFLETVKKEIGTAILFLFSSCCITLFYYLLYGLDHIVYPMAISVFFFTIYFIYKLFVYKSFYDALYRSKDSPKFSGYRNGNFNEVIEHIRDIHSSYISKITDAQNSNNEREKVLIEWIHNMKTSVAVINLALEKLEDSDVKRDIESENELLKKNLEGALNMFRLGEFHKDYVPEKVDLKKFVKECINVNKRNFIYANIFPKVYIPDECFILTDKKWGKYVINQIISNAVKYSNKNAEVTFNAVWDDDTVTLSIKDSGVGIKKEDMSRVFDAFFTGTNGRYDSQKSSGIGLYMCKEICEKLDNKISIQSEEGIGTTVSITYLKADVYR